MKKLLLYVLVAFALGYFLMDYWEVRQQALCAHATVIRMGTH